MTDPHDDATSGPTRTDPAEITAEDATLLAELESAVAIHDPVPPQVTAAARAAFTWRTVDAELAELVFDSAVEVTGVRGMAWPRQLSFEARDTSIEIEITDDRIVGQVVPPAAIEIVITSPDGTEQTGRADTTGHFTFSDLGPGTVRIHAGLPDGTVTTQWFTLG